MRAALLAPALLAALAIPAAHADIITLTVNATDGGSGTYYYDTTGPTDGSYDAATGQYQGAVDGYYLYALDTGEFVLFNTLTNGQDSGGLDAFFDNGMDDSYFSGVQLYSGSELAPVFTNGTYALDAETYYGYDDTGTVTISGGVNPVSTVAATPEPSSLALLGTGALGLIGIARRRFRRA